MIRNPFKRSRQPEGSPAGKGGEFRAENRSRVDLDLELSPKPTKYYPVGHPRGGLPIVEPLSREPQDAGVTGGPVSETEGETDMSVYTAGADRYAFAAPLNLGGRWAGPPAAIPLDTVDWPNHGQLDAERVAVGKIRVYAVDGSWETTDPREVRSFMDQWAVGPKRTNKVPEDRYAGTPSRAIRPDWKPVIPSSWSPNVR